MATPQNDEFLSIVGSISKFAGALVGTAVITGKRILGEAKPPSEGSSDKLRKKNIPAQTNTKKKKAVKRKPAGSSGKSGASKKKPARSPAKKKKIATPKKKTVKRKTKKATKNELTSNSPDGLISETSAETTVPIEKQEPQVQQPIAEAEIADEKSSNVNGLPEKGTEKESTTESQKPSIPIIEYSDKADKAVVPTTSLF